MVLRQVVNTSPSKDSPLGRENRNQVVRKSSELPRPGTNVSALAREGDLYSLPTLLQAFL